MTKMTSKGQATVPGFIRKKMGFGAVGSFLVNTLVRHLQLLAVFKEVDFADKSANRYKAGDYLIWEIQNDVAVVRNPKDLMDYLGCLENANLPDDEEELLTPEFGRKMLEREE